MKEEKMIWKEKKGDDVSYSTPKLLVLGTNSPQLSSEFFCLDLKRTCYAVDVANTWDNKPNKRHNIEGTLQEQCFEITLWVCHFICTSYARQFFLFCIQSMVSKLETRIRSTVTNHPIPSPLPKLIWMMLQEGAWVISVVLRPAADLELWQQFVHAYTGGFRN